MANDKQPSAPACDPADGKAIEMRSSIATRTRMKIALDSISDMSKLITGPLVALGGSTLIAAMVTQPHLAAALLPWGIGLLMAAAVVLTTAIVASHVSSSMRKKSTIDQTELAAQRTAYHLVQALKSNNLCLAPDEQAKEKSWQQQVAKQRDDPQSPNRTIH